MQRRWTILAVAAVLAISAAASAAVEGFLQIAINEVELNPSGRDAGNEWVELVNKSDVEIDLDGWSLTFNYRSEGTVLISEGELLLGAGGRYVFVYPRLMLRNDDNTWIQLLAPDGSIVDQTPTMNDTKDDGQTWQRYPDGGDPLFADFWILGNGTRGAVNE